MVRERRWIILAEDGRHVTLGYESDPTDAEIGQVGKSLRDQKLGGWLAVLEGRYYHARGPISLMMVRQVSPSSGSDWTQAETVFRQRRDESLRGT